MFSAFFAFWELSFWKRLFWRPSAFVASWEDQVYPTYRWNFQLLLHLRRKVRLWGNIPDHHILCSGICHPSWYPEAHSLGSGVCFSFWFDDAYALDSCVFPQVMHVGICVQESGDHLAFLCVEINVRADLRQVGTVLGSGVWDPRSGDMYVRKSLLGWVVPLPYYLRVYGVGSSLVQ